MAKAVIDAARAMLRELTAENDFAGWDVAPARIDVPTEEAGVTLVGADGAPVRQYHVDLSGDKTSLRRRFGGSASLVDAMDDNHDANLRIRSRVRRGALVVALVTGALVCGIGVAIVTGFVGRTPVVPAPVPLVVDTGARDAKGPTIVDARQRRRVVALGPYGEGGCRRAMQRWRTMDDFYERAPACADGRLFVGRPPEEVVGDAQELIVYVNRLGARVDVNDDRGLWWVHREGPRAWMAPLVDVTAALDDWLLREPINCTAPVDAPARQPPLRFACAAMVADNGGGDVVPCACAWRTADGMPMRAHRPRIATTHDDHQQAVVADRLWFVDAMSDADRRRESPDIMANAVDVGYDGWTADNAQRRFVRMTGKDAALAQRAVQFVGRRIESA